MLLGESNVIPKLCFSHFFVPKSNKNSYIRTKILPLAEKSYSLCHDLGQLYINFAAEFEN